MSFLVYDELYYKLVEAEGFFGINSSPETAHPLSLRDIPLIRGSHSFTDSKQQVYGWQADKKGIYAKLVEPGLCPKKKNHLLCRWILIICSLFGIRLGLCHSFS